MILLIDIGNSRVNWAYWDENQKGLLFSQTGSMSIYDIKVESMLTGRSVDRIFIANVAGDTIGRQFAANLSKHINNTTVEFLATENHLLGLKLAYDQPEQLGVDRWLAMIGSMQWPNTAKLIADCGTAVTVDIVDRGGMHHGGIIMPGLRIMREQLNKQTHNVQSLLQDVDYVLGRNTQQCVNIGCESAITGAIEYLYHHSGLNIDKQLQCILAGGDAVRIGTKLTIQSDLCEHLVLQGMAMIASQRS